MTVLLADEIKRLCETSSPMIEPFSPSQLRPASYQLTLGDEAHLGGEHKNVHHSTGITLEPHQVAVVCTRETLRIPRELIARWSLRVTNIYEGLLWTGGPQVDPGWTGPLFCPIYNLAERTVILKYGDPLFTIDFVQTTGVGPELVELKKEPEFKEVWFKPKRRTLSEHDRHRLHSAPYEALRELRELRYFRNVGYVAITLVMLVLTLMVGALAVLVTERPPVLNDSIPPPWPVVAYAGVAFLSLLSIAVSCITMLRFRKFL